LGSKRKSSEPSVKTFETLTDSFNELKSGKALGGVFWSEGGLGGGRGAIGFKGTEGGGTKRRKKTQEKKTTRSKEKCLRKSLGKEHSEPTPEEGKGKSREIAIIRTTKRERKRKTGGSKQKARGVGGKEKRNPRNIRGSPEGTGSANAA